MNESTIKGIANEQMPVYTLIRGFINTINYINIGVITRVHDENYVDVSLYYTNNAGKKVQIQAVRVLHLGTTKCKINITPAVGDNVLLLCPKDFIEKLEYNRIAQRSGNSYLPYGNLNMCCFLIKAEGDDNVKTTIGINEKGDISVETDGKTDIYAKGDITVKTDGDAKVTASNITAMCTSFVVKANENASPAFEVTP